MRLINTTSLALEVFNDTGVPTYAILSHTWGEEEVTFQEMCSESSSKERKLGYSKILGAAKIAREDMFDYVWVDTCCINKESSTELQEAINSMWRYYAEAAQCYAYLDDVYSENKETVSPMNIETLDAAMKEISLSELPEGFSASKWFTRGWTLQELIAPKSVVFLDYRWRRVGTKHNLSRSLAIITGIDASILAGEGSIFSVSVAKRMCWAANRETSRIEDRAYSLLGIFDVNMPMLYGEGKKAFRRLQEEIIKSSTDQSIFVWRHVDGPNKDSNNDPLLGTLLAESPRNFMHSNTVVCWGDPWSFEMTNRGLRIELPVKHDANSLVAYGILNCRPENHTDRIFALTLQKYPHDSFLSVTNGKRNEIISVHVGDLGSESRLSLVSERELAKISTWPLQITRTFVAKEMDFRIMLDFHADALGSGVHITEFYPEGKWDIENRIMHMNQERTVTAAVVIRCPSGTRFTLIFGFDRGLQMNTRLWMMSRVPQSLETFCQSFGCNANEWPKPLQNFTGPESSGPETLTASANIKQVLGVPSLVINVNVWRQGLFELDAGPGAEIDSPGSIKLIGERKTGVTDVETPQTSFIIHA